MLRGRRLPVSLSPLPRWRTAATKPREGTVPVVAAAARFGSSSPSTPTTTTPPTLTDGYGADHSALARALEEQVPVWERGGEPGEHEGEEFRLVEEARQELHTLADGPRYFRTYTPAGKDYFRDEDLRESTSQITYYRHSGHGSLPVEKPYHARTDPSAPGSQGKREVREPEPGRPEGLAFPRSGLPPAKAAMDGQSRGRLMRPFPSHVDLIRAGRRPFQAAEASVGAQSERAQPWRKIRAPDKNIAPEDRQARALFTKPAPIYLNLQMTGRRPFRPMEASAKAQDDGERTRLNTVAPLERHIRPKGPDPHHAAAENGARQGPRQPYPHDPSSSSSRRAELQRRGDPGEARQGNPRSHATVPAAGKKPSRLLDAHLQAMADQLGIEVSQKPTDVKRAIARSLGFKSWDEAPLKARVASHTPIPTTTQSAATPGEVNLVQGASDTTGADSPKAEPHGISEKHVPGGRPVGPPHVVHQHERTILSAYSPQTFNPAKAQKDINFDMRRNWLLPETSSVNTSSRPVQLQPRPLGVTSDLGLEEQRRSSFSIPGRIEQTFLDKDVQHGTARDAARSIFEMLFPEESEHKSRSLNPVPSELRGHPLEMGSDVDPRAKYFIDVSAKPRQASGSIYKQLFPDQPLPPGPEAVKKDEPQELPGDSQAASGTPLLVSLRNEVRNWIPEEDREHLTAPEAGKYGSHSTVVVISGVSNSLVDTDFYRVIPEGKYVEGWAGGLVKVVQARDPLTYEPVGQYFLMFHSRAPAVAYAEEAKRLHELSRRLLHSAARGPLDAATPDPQPFLTDEERAAVQSFTICSPAAPLRISVRMWTTQVVGQIASKTNIADVVQSLRPEAETPAKVLISIDVGGRASGGGLTPAELWLMLRDDGRERGTPWALINLREGIRPVKVTAVTEGQDIRVTTETVDAPLQGEDYDEVEVVRAPPAESESLVELGPAPSQNEAGLSEKESGGGGGGGVGPPDERFQRFVLTFKQRAIARRFVRCWHKRPIYDAELGRTVLVDAVALM